MDPLPQRLLTLVHISDLHFGHPPAEEGNAPRSDWHRQFSVYDGLLGHHYRALDDLTAYIKRLRMVETDPPPIVVLTGDLTACGKRAEFRRAVKFVRSSYMVGDNPIGLNERDIWTRTIPGNHDNWPGTGDVCGPKTSTFKRLFGKPMKMFQKTLASGHEFQLFGIDSDANVTATDWDRRLARGSFKAETDRLDLTTLTPAPDQIRAVLVHHSPAYFSMMTKLEVRSKSLHALNHWMADAGISVMLTGHIHEAGGFVTTMTSHTTKWDLLEARCGTTTQLDRASAGWKWKGTWNADRLPINSLLVHRLMHYGNEIRWEVEFVERLHYGFTSERTLPGMARPSIRVWPR